MKEPQPPYQPSGCSAGYYHAGQSIQVTASPATGWQVGGWLGTSNNASTSTVNSLTMPAGNHTVAVEYEQSCYLLTRTHTGSGGDPVASPSSSSGCAAGRYHYGETVLLTATPTAGWGVSSWGGTSNDASTSITNSLTMPAGSHTATVNYAQICFALALSHTGSGQNPAASPAGSPGCAVGGFHFGEAIQVTAGPSAGWEVASWVGTGNDGSTSLVNNLHAARQPHGDRELRPVLPRRDLQPHRNGKRSGAVARPLSGLPGRRVPCR